MGRIFVEHPRLALGLFLVGSMLLIRSGWEAKTRERLRLVEQRLHELGVPAEVDIPDEQNALICQIKAVEAAPKTPPRIAYDDFMNEYMENHRVIQLGPKSSIIINDSYKEALKEASYAQAFGWLEKGRNCRLDPVPDYLNEPEERQGFLDLYSALCDSAKHHIRIEKYAVALDRLYDAALLQQTLYLISPSYVYGFDDNCDLMKICEVIITLPTDDLASLRPGLDRILKLIVKNTFSTDGYSGEYFWHRRWVKSLEPELWLIKPAMNDLHRLSAEIYLRRQLSFEDIATPAPAAAPWLLKIDVVGDFWAPDWIPESKLRRPQETLVLAGQIGLILYYIDHGVWPDSLEGLSPKYIPDKEMFKDFYGKRPSLYKDFDDFRTSVTPPMENPGERGN